MPLDPINLSIRKYSITIGNLTCAPALVSFQGSDSKLDQSGLITFTGTIVLGRPDGFETLDDRRNNRWARGQKIILQIADKAGLLRRSPRGAEVHILDSQFDLKTRKLTLHVGDIFELLKIKEPKGDASKICVGTSTSRTEIINRLLTAAGAPPLIDSVPGALNSPTPRLLEGSFIEQAGAIAAAAGYFLWVDSLGQVRASQIITNPASLMAIDLVGQAADYQRLEGEQPAERVVVNGKVTIVRITQEITEITTEEFGAALLAGSGSTREILIKRTRILDRFNRGSKVRTIETWISQPMGMVFPEDPVYQGRTGLIDAEYRIETYAYEQHAPITGHSGDTHCTQGNQGRLRKHITQIYKAKGVVFREIFATYPEKNPITGKRDPVLAEETQISYDYDGGTSSKAVGLLTLGEDLPAELEKLGDGPKITSRTWKAIGSVIPGDFAYTESPTVILIRAMASMHEVERNIQVWQELRFGEWRKDDTTYQALTIAQPQIADKLREVVQKQNKLYDPAKLLGLRETNNTVTVSRSGQAQPPAPETYSPAFSTQELTVKGKANFPVDIDSPYRPRERQFSFEYLSAVGGGNGAGAVQVATNEANRLARIWGAVLWGRHKGATISTELGDAWFDYQPIARCDVAEPDGIAAYLMDGFAIAILDKRCVVAFDGMLLGWTSAETPTVIAPVYRTNREMNVQASGMVSYRTAIFENDAVAINYSLQASGMVSYRTSSEAFRYEVQGSGMARYQRSFGVMRVQGSGSSAWARSINWDEITFEQWRNMSDFQWTKIYPPGT